MLMRFEPFREFDRITEELLAQRRVRQVPVDAYRRANEFKIALDLPGADPGSMDLTVEKDVLTVGATRTRYQEEGDEIMVAERGHGQLRGPLFLGESLDREHTGDVRRRRFGTDTPTKPATASTDLPPVAVGLSRTCWTTKRKIRTDYASATSPPQRSNRPPTPVHFPPLEGPGRLGWTRNRLARPRHGP